jgi:hypothetical protein
LLFGSAVMPATMPATMAAAADEAAMVPSKWSLDEAAKTGATAQRDASKKRRAAAANRRNRPRIIGGAQVSNSRLRSKKSSASVGVAVPF